MDGVLVDTEAIWEHVRRRFVAEHGGTYTDRATRDVMGMSAPEWSRYIRTELHVDLPDEQINDGIVAGVAASLRKTLPLFPGACEAVTTLSRCVPLAVASSSNRSLIDYIVAEAGLAAAFHATVSSEEVPHGKPAPDVYLRAAELLRVAAERCGAIEDSSNGLRAAHAAGMFVVALPNPQYPPAADALALADVVLERIADVVPATFCITPPCGTPLY